MSNELVVVGIVLIWLAFNYLLIYPKFGRLDVKRIAWLDAITGAFALGLIAGIYQVWGEDVERFSLLGFETNWFVFTIVVMAALETPAFWYYVKANKLGGQYKAAMSLKGKDWYSGVGVPEVKKQLDDTKWDWLRTSSAKRNLVIGSNTLLLLGTFFLIFVGDNNWSIYSIVHIIFLFTFWFLLRTSVRLVSEAPDAALDEMMIAERNRSYYSAYRVLSFIALSAATALMVYSIVADARNTSTNDFIYALEFTWPQVQAIFWFLFGYAMILPSMSLAWQQSRRRSEVKI